MDVPNRETAGKSSRAAQNALKGGGTIGTEAWPDKAVSILRKTFRSAADRDSRYRRRDMGYRVRNQKYFNHLANSSAKEIKRIAGLAGYLSGFAPGKLSGELERRSG